MPSKTLKDSLASKAEGQYYLAELNNIKQKAAPKLEKIQETFPFYTEHDIRHSERVIQVLDSYIPDPLKDLFSELELFFLLASVYLHDVGMQRFAPQIEEKISNCLSSCVNTCPSDDEIRENHHLRSEVYITKCYTDLSIQDVHQANIIGRICRGHRNENLFDPKIFAPNQIYKRHSINTPLLAALLRVGDELDITFERASLALYKQIPDDDVVTKSEWDKHLSIAGVARVRDDPLKLKSSATCEDPKIHRLLRKLESKINSQLNTVLELSYQYPNVVTSLPRQFAIGIEARGYVPYDFKFSVETSAIMQLLMGKNLYKSPAESVRELLKNSLDSCRLKQKIAGRGYNPIIEIEQPLDKSALIICDNGCGMDQYIIENFFTRIGRSYYQSREFHQKEVEFAPVSEFGIGIASCFMIARRIVVETKAQNQPPFKIEIEDFADYFIVHDGDRKADGTKITLDLKDKAKELDYEEIIETYARHLEIPIVTHINGGTRLIKDLGYHPQFAIPDACNLQEIEINCKEVQGLFAFILKKTQKGHWAACKAREISEENFLDLLNFISYEGVFVTHSSILPKWLFTKKGASSIYLDLNLKKSSGISLNLARNELLKDEEFDRAGKIVEDHIAKLIRNVVCKLSKSSSEAGLRSRDVIIRFFKTFVCFNDVIDQRTCKVMADLFKDFYSFAVLSKSGLRYMYASEIIETHKRIVVLDSIPNGSSGYVSYAEWWRPPNTGYLVKMIRDCSGFSNDEVYIVPDYTYFSYGNIQRLLDLIFPSYETTGFLTFFKFVEDKRLKNVLPPDWVVLKFGNSTSDRLIEFVDNYRRFLNSNNKFVQLLLENKERLSAYQKKLIIEFCEVLEQELRDKPTIIQAQKKMTSILKTFVRAGIIKNVDIQSCLIAEDDFPPDLHEEWLG